MGEEGRVTEREKTRSLHIQTTISQKNINYLNGAVIRK